MLREQKAHEEQDHSSSYKLVGSSSVSYYQSLTFPKTEVESVPAIASQDHFGTKRL
jgi:hypothetical protein